MNTEINDKIAKVLELALRGVDGEKAAAQKALERLMKKYDLSDEDLSKIKLKRYYFPYKTELDKKLFCQLAEFFLNISSSRMYLHTYPERRISVDLEYLDWVTLDSAYGYFRKHAAAQFKEFCLPHVKRCRTTKTKNAKRSELQNHFFSKYVIASKIYRSEQLMQIDYAEMSNREREASYKRGQILGNVKGGEFHTQVATKETKLLSLP